MDASAKPLVGGRYVVEDGVRRLVEEPTAEHPEGNRARESDGAPIGGPEASAAPQKEPGRKRGGTKGAD